MLLRFPAELAMTERYWSFEQENLQFCDGYVRRALFMLRAIALTDKGRTSEANKVLGQLPGQFKADDEPAQRASVQALLAELSLERGETRAALWWIENATEGGALMQDEDRRHTAQAWRIHINALLRAGRTDDLRRTAIAMLAWAAAVMRQDAWIRLYVLRAEVAQAMERRS